MRRWGCCFGENDLGRRQEGGESPVDELYCKKGLEMGSGVWNR